MKKVLVAGIVGVLLAGCSNSYEEQKASTDLLNSNLPEGCALTFAGRFIEQGSQNRHGIPVVVVQCKSQDATTTNGTYKHGKTLRSFATVAVD